MRRKGKKEESEYWMIKITARLSQAKFINKEQTDGSLRSSNNLLL